MSNFPTKYDFCLIEQGYMARLNRDILSIYGIMESKEFGSRERGEYCRSGGGWGKNRR